MDDVTVESHIVSQDAKPDRLSDYACGVFESLPSRKSVKKAIKRGELLVNGNKSETGHWVKPGELLSVVIKPSHLPVYERELECIFEDNHIAVVVKPADLPVSGFQLRNLQNALAQNINPSAEIDALSVPRPVHRLDRQTGGIILIAKTLSAAANLGKQFENRTVDKRYTAIAAGNLAEVMKFTEPIYGQDAFTSILPLRQLHHPKHGHFSLVEAKPKTGRRNQIRTHLSNAGFPILGDLKFGGPHSGRGLFLFARYLRFKHPKSGSEVDFELELPRKFRRYFPE